jgi:hypothetical protein
LKGRLLDENVLILREFHQSGTFTDPVTKRKHDIQLTTWIGGSNQGCPIVELAGRMVAFDFKDIADEAVRILRENGVLPKELEAIDE